MNISITFLAMFITCIIMTFIVATWFQLRVFNEPDPGNRVRKGREFLFCMKWMAVLDFTTLFAAIISKLIEIW